MHHIIIVSKGANHKLCYKKKTSATVEHRKLMDAWREWVKGFETKDKLYEMMDDYGTVIDLDLEVVYSTQCVDQEVEMQVGREVTILQMLNEDTLANEIDKDEKLKKVRARRNANRAL